MPPSLKKKLWLKTSKSKKAELKCVQQPHPSPWSQQTRTLAKPSAKQHKPLQYFNRWSWQSANLHIFLEIQYKNILGRLLLASFSPTALLLHLTKPLLIGRSFGKGKTKSHILWKYIFLASQDALEVMRVTHSLTNWVSFSIDLTDVTLVSDYTYRRLYWCDSDYPDGPDESYLAMKVI